MKKLLCIASFCSLLAEQSQSQLLVDGYFQPPAAGDYLYSLHLQANDKVLTYFVQAGSKYVSRYNTDGTLDAHLAYVNDDVFSYATQPDGRTLIGGSFTVVDGTSKGYIARIDPNGGLDVNYICGTNHWVQTIAVESSGKILLGGSFSTFYWTGGNSATRNRIVRTETNGSLDNSFSIGTGFNNTVTKIVPLSNGQILVCGQFTQFDGNMKQSFVRLNSDGTLDNTFTTGIASPSVVTDIEVLSNGKILITGNFTTYSGVNRKNIARLNADGTLDTSFDPGVANSNGTIYTVEELNDGKLLIAGDFSTYNGQSAISGVAILQANGSFDSFPLMGTGFDMGLRTIAQRTDGSFIVGGGLNLYNGQPVRDLVRLVNCPASGTPSNLTDPASLFVCPNSTTTLEAVGIGRLAWFNAPIGGSFLGLGEQFTTPNLSNTTTFYVQNDTACPATGRTAITVQVPQATFSQTVSICAGESYSYNGNTYTMPGTYTDVLAGMSASGCDSTVITTLQVNTVDAGYTVDQTNFSASLNQAGANYQWYQCFVGYLDYLIPNATAQSYTAPYNGVQLAAVVEQNGCLDTTDCFCMMDTTVNVNGSTLSGNYYVEDTEEFYWFDCMSGSGEPPILGTGGTFTPTVSGYYAFAGGAPGCDLLSECIYFDILSSTQTFTHAESGIRLSPNPAKDYCLLDGLQPAARVQLLDLAGKLLEEQVADRTQLTCNTSLLQNGVYLLRIEQNGNIYTQKLVICK